MAGVKAHVFPTQEHVYFSKRWPLALLSVPTFAHKIIYLLWAVRRVGQNDMVVVVSIVMPGISNHFFVRQTFERLLARERQNLPQRHRERPHVTLSRKLALKIQTAVSWILSKVKIDFYNVDLHSLFDLHLTKAYVLVVAASTSLSPSQSPLLAFQHVFAM